MTKTRKPNYAAKLLTDDDVRLLARVRLVSEGKLDGATALTVAEWDRAELLTEIVCAFAA
jgi:hypothetical protein